MLCTMLTGLKRSNQQLQQVLRTYTAMHGCITKLSLFMRTVNMKRFTGLNFHSFTVFKSTVKIFP